MLRPRAARSTIIALTLIALTTLALPAAAEADEKYWRIRFEGLWLDPDLSFEEVDGGDRLVVESDRQFGAAIALSYRFSRRLSFEVGTAFAEPDVTVRFEFASGARLEAIDALRFQPITAGLNLHLTPDRKVDVTVGALAAYSLYGDLAFDFAGIASAALDSADDFGWGVSFGVAVPWSAGRWSLHAGAQYLDTTVDLTDRSDGELSTLDFDPLMARAGIGLRF